MSQGPVGGGLATVRWIFTIAGAVSFIAGYGIAVIGGIWWPDSSGLIATLVIMGLIVGVFNVTAREVVTYLIAAIALVLVGNLHAFTPLNSVVGGLGDRVNDVVGMMAIFTAPAAVIQAVRAGVAMARPGSE
ncbi:MAG: hypothetical protein HYY00_04410 [Chloroflexi bacterium]|nr:hypothetical protein [Chloroflexota bacterium]